MRYSARIGSIVLLLAASAVAQTRRPLAYPQDTLFGTTSIVEPFGVWRLDDRADEARFHQLFLARHLPSPGAAILGIMIHCQSHAGNIAYRDLTITFSHVTSNVLSPRFDDNVPNPQVVMTGAQTILWDQRDWTRIIFPTSFPYDGTSNLVLEVRKTFDRGSGSPTGDATMAVDGDSARTDWPHPIWTAGYGAANAALATTRYEHPLQVRLIFADTPTLYVTSHPGGARYRTFALGTTATVTVRAPYVTGVVTFFHGAFQTPVAYPSVAGLAYIPLQHVFDSTIMGSNESSDRSAPIPSLPSLVGSRVVFQALVVNTNTSTVSFTNAMDVVIDE